MASLLLATTPQPQRPKRPYPTKLTLGTFIPGSMATAAVTQTISSEQLYRQLESKNKRPDGGISRVHEPTFVYRVTVNDMVATGQGKSKKLAKHLAAKGLLEQIVSANRYIEWAIPGRSHSEAMEYLQKLLPEQTGGKGGVRKDGSGVEGNEADGAGEKGPLVNPIGRLQEKCMRNRWPPPEYELLEECGQPHERTFVVSVKLGKFEEKGEAKSKKTAKRIVAEKMLVFLENLRKDKYDADEDGLAEECENPGDAYPLELEEQLKSLSVSEKESKEISEEGTGGGSEAPDPPKEKLGMKILTRTDLKTEDVSGKSKELLKRISLEEQFKQSLRLLENTVKPLTALDVQRIEAFFSPIQRQPGEHLRGLRGRHKGGSPGAGGDQGMDLRDAPRFLARIGEEHNFRVTYVDIEQRREDGQYQCLVQLSTMPVAVCYGSGKTKDEAQFTAAHNALYYLKIMTKNEGIDM